MKKGKMILIISIIILTLVSIFITTVYADPNSSKGFAEFDDATADEEAQKLLEEQQKEVQQSVGKSTNNYLDNLQVEGYELTPKFDKQTVDYEIKNAVNSSQIKINATPSDSKAKVQGAGTVKIENGKTDYRIDVTSESGTVRTYIIHLTGQPTEQQGTEQETNQEPEQKEEPTQQEDEQSNTVVSEETSTIPEMQSGNEQNESSGGYIIWIVAGIIIAVIIIAIIVVKRFSR